MGGVMRRGARDGARDGARNTMQNVMQQWLLSGGSGGARATSEAATADAFEHDNSYCQMCFRAPSGDDDVHSGAEKEGADAPQLTESSIKLLPSTAQLEQFIHDEVWHTPFLSKYLQHLLKKNGHFVLCNHCDCWIRRRRLPHRSGGVVHTKKKRRNQGGNQGVAASAKVLLPLDQLILSIMVPGKYQPPEMRTTNHLVASAVCNGGVNPLASICPPLVMHTLLMGGEICTDKRTVQKSVLFSMWKHGRQQPATANQEFIKFVRKSLNYSYSASAQ